MKCRSTTRTWFDGALANLLKTPQSATARPNSCTEYLLTIHNYLLTSKQQLLRLSPKLQCRQASFPHDAVLLADMRPQVRRAVPSLLSIQTSRNRTTEPTLGYDSGPDCMCHLRMLVDIFAAGKAFCSDAAGLRTAVGPRVGECVSPGEDMSITSISIARCGRYKTLTVRPTRSAAGRCRWHTEQRLLVGRRLLAVCFDAADLFSTVCFHDGSH